MGQWRLMKTTLEIPDELFRRAKLAAAEQGIPLRKLVSEALAEQLRARACHEKPWLQTFGKLRNLRKETASTVLSRLNLGGSILRIGSDPGYERAIGHGGRRHETGAPPQALRGGKLAMPADKSARGCDHCPCL
jgi:hypothetical protein